MTGWPPPFPTTYVVGPPGAPRGRALTGGLDALGVPWTATGGPRPEDGTWWKGVEVDQAAAAVLERRTLVRGEVAAVLAHRAAVAAAHASGAEWAVVLEDDAVLGPTYVTVCRAAAAHVTRRPTVVLLYRDPHTVCRPLPPGRTGPRPVVGLPQGAVGYLLNRASMAGYPVSGPVTGVADWPHPWCAHQRFLQASPAPVTTGVEPSLIGDVRALGWGAAAEPWPRRTARLVATLTALRYLRHRTVYGSWRGYRTREYARLTGALLERLVR